MDKKLNFTKRKLTNKKASSILKNILPTTPLMENKLTSPKKVNRIITLLPLKYRFLLFFLFIVSGVMIGALIKEFIKFGYNYDLSQGITAVFIFIPLFFLLLKFFEQKINRNTIVKVNIIYCLFLAILNFYLLYIGLEKGAYCHISPSMLRNGYPPCYYELKEYERMAFIFYHIYVIFIISFGSLILLFSQEITKTTKICKKLLFFIMLCITTLIPEIIEYSVKF